MMTKANIIGGGIAFAIAGAVAAIIDLSEPGGSFIEIFVAVIFFAVFLGLLGAVAIYLRGVFSLLFFPTIYGSIFFILVYAAIWGETGEEDGDAVEPPSSAIEAEE